LVGLQQITIHRPGPDIRNEYGELVPGPEVDVSATGRVRPTSAREITSGQQTLLVDAVGVIKTVDGAKATDESVFETDELTAGGKRYRVVGRFFVQSEGGALDHVRTDLRAVT
jgi:hypothetical protein